MKEGRRDRSKQAMRIWPVGNHSEIVGRAIFKIIVKSPFILQLKKPKCRGIRGLV